MCTDAVKKMHVVTMKCNFTGFLSRGEKERRNVTFVQMFLDTLLRKLEYRVVDLHCVFCVPVTERIIVSPEVAVRSSEVAPD